MYWVNPGSSWAEQFSETRMKKITLASFPYRKTKNLTFLSICLICGELQIKSLLFAQSFFVQPLLFYAFFIRHFMCISVLNVICPAALPLPDNTNKRARLIR
jgi:hypothetical protein